MLDILEPYLVSAFGVVVSALLAIATRQLTKWTGIEIEAKHRQALHEAIVSGVHSAVKHGIETGSGTFYAHVMAHVRESVPDAYKTLVRSEGVVRNIIDRYNDMRDKR